jgi:hypothetical protein
MLFSVCTYIHTTPPTYAAAKSMGFESSPPPYLSMASSSDQLVQTALAAGVSYASAGAGILDSSVSVFSKTLTFIYIQVIK